MAGEDSVTVATLAIRSASWVVAARPKTLTAAFAPTLVGTACAASVGRFAFGPALAALLGAVFIQVGTNFANDVFDYEKGADTEERLGPLRMVQAGLLTPRAMRVGMWMAFGLAGLAGVYLTWVAGWVVVAIGLASIACGIAYTGGPFPLAYHGLGDVFVMLFFGFVAVTATAWVQVGSVPSVAWWAAVPVGALATTILVVNNLRDVEADTRANKRTLVVRWGRQTGIAEFALLLAAAYVVPCGLAAFRVEGLGVLLPCLSLPFAIWLGREVARRRGVALNPLLPAASFLLLGYSALFALGLAW